MQFQYLSRKIKITVERSFLGAFYIKANRKRLQKKHEKNKKEKVPIAKPGKKLSSLFAQRKFLVVSVFFLLIVLSFIISRAYFALTFAPQNLEGGTSPMVVSQGLNILLIGYDEQGDYKFIDFLAIVRINFQEEAHRVLLIDPDFAMPLLKKKALRLRNLLNNAEVAQEPELDVLIKALESLVAIPIDRYAAIKIDDLQKVLEQMDVSYRVEVAINDENTGSFSVGEVLKGASLIDYLAADQPGAENRQKRQEQFLITQFAEKASFLGFIKLLFQGELITSHLETNLTRAEIVNIAFSMFNKGALRVASIGEKQGYRASNQAESYLLPDQTNVKNVVQNLFARTAIAKEQGRIEIYNATLVNGLATKNKRILENLGAIIIRAGNAADQEERSQLFVAHPEKYPYTIMLVREVLRGEVLLVQEEYPYNHTGELVLILGGDLVD